MDGGKEREKGGGRAAEGWAKGETGKREERSGEGERDSSQRGAGGRRDSRAQPWASMFPLLKVSQPKDSLSLQPFAASLGSGTPL